MITLSEDKTSVAIILAGEIAKGLVLNLYSKFTILVFVIYFR
jgi:hypothetical protein